MNGRRLIALVLLVALAVIAALLHPCRVANETPTTSTPLPAVPPATHSVAEPGAKTRRHAPADVDVGESPDETPTAPTKPATVLVHVVSADDKAPIAGADVVLSESKDGGDDVEISERTDAAGVARFADLEPGTKLARAFGLEWVRSDFTGDRAEPGETLTIEIELSRGVALDGVVVDDRSGRPIAGATVDVVLGGSLEGLGSTFTTKPHLGLLTTGDDGRFRLHVPPNEMVTPTASANGFVACARTVVAPAGDRALPAVELRLEPGGSLRGVVRAPNGGPVAGATVEARPEDGSEEPCRVATTDPAGRYEVVGLVRGGVYSASAGASGWARSLPVSGVLVTEAAPAAESDFVLRKWGSLSVHVVRSDGTPAAAQVLVESDSAHDGRNTDLTGVAEFADLTPGPVRIKTVAKLAPSATAAVDVPEGATVDTTLRLERGAEIDGVVVDDVGAPVAAAAIHFGCWSEASGSESLGSTTTTPDGRFHLDGLRVARHWLVAQGAFRRTSARAELDAPAADVRLVLPRTGRATLALVAPPGVALPTEVTVQEQPALEADDSWNMGGLTMALSGGRLTLDNLDPCAWRVRVSGADFAPVVREFEIRSGGTTDVGEATLDAGLSSDGVVEDVGGAPVVGAHVVVGRRFTPACQDVVTTTDGRFHFDHLARGPASFTVAAFDFLTVTIPVDVAPGIAPIVVRLAHGGVVRVTVVDAAGAPVVGTTVEFRLVGETSLATSNQTDFRGRVENRVAAGKYRVTVTDRDAAADVDVVEGGGAAIRLVVK